MISHLKLAPKLIGGFGSVVFLFVCVMGIYHSSVKFTLSRFNELMVVDQAVSDHAGILETTVYQARIEEADFFRTNDFESGKAMADIVDKVVLESQSIAKLAKQVGETKIQSMTQEINTLIRAYLDDFNQTVDAIRTRGVDDQSGLRGEFSSIVTKFMDDMSFLQVGDYYIEVFRIQRAQTEYMLYKKQRILKRIFASLDTLKKVADNDVDENAVKQIIKTMILDIIPQYRKSLNNLMEKGPGISFDDEDFQDMNDSLNEVSEVLRAAYFNDARGYALAIRINEKDYLLTKNETYAKETKNSIQTLLTKIADSPVERDYVDQAEKNLGNYEKAFDKIVQLDRQIAGLKERMDQTILKISSVVKDLNDTAKKASMKKRTMTESQVNHRVFIAFMIGLGAILLGMGLSVGITRSITRPIVDTVAFSERMAKGDLSQKITIDRHDEVGILAKALNGMVANLNSMFSGISNGVDELTQASTSLSEISDEMKTGAEKTQEKSGIVSGASGQMNDNMAKVAATVQEAAASMTHISKTTQDMNQTIGGISQSTEEARSISDAAVAKADVARNKIGDLEQAAQEIGKVTETIRDISDQTNLLALNATIESARAGEAGKGFAVVANEIKTLAQQTADATREISQKIEGVQAISKETMEAILEITGVIANINDIIVSISSSMKDQSLTTQDINANISKTSEGIQQINDMMTENSMMITTIVDDISEVSHASDEMTQGSYRVSEKSQDLKQLASRLKEMADQFTL